MTKAEFRALPRTSRGWLDMLQMQDRHGVEVVVRESSLACEGAHVRVCLSATETSQRHGMAPDALHLNVEQAEKLRDALTAFIEAARDGWLTEPADAE